MLKKSIKKMFNVLGYDIRRIDVPRVDNTGSKKTSKLSYYETATGNYFLPTDAVDDIVANKIINNQIFEQEVVDLAKQYIRPGTVVLDVGCNFGQMSILFAKMTGDGGMVHSFDADDWVYEVFNKNIAANHITNIIPHFGAVHNKDGEILLFPEQDFVEYGTYGSYGIDYNATTGRQVKTLTIDSLDITDEISFMKIDIQGGDLQAMQGAVKTIARHRMPIIFEYEYHFEEQFKMSFQDYVDFVASINYRFARVISGHNFLILPK